MPYANIDQVREELHHVTELVDDVATRDDPSEVNAQDSQDLEAGLANVLAPVLVSSASGAHEALRSTGVSEAIADARGAVSGAGALDAVLPVVAAALGSAAAPAVASALASWLRHARRQSDAQSRSWLQPDIDESAVPVFCTLTEFARDRSRLVRESIDERRPVVLSRYGKVVAAVVPLQEGAYEESVYRRAASKLYEEQRARQSEDAVELLDESTVEEILASENPAETAARYGVDTSTWPTPVDSRAQPGSVGSSHANDV